MTKKGSKDKAFVLNVECESKLIIGGFWRLEFEQLSILRYQYFMG